LWICGLFFEMSNILVWSGVYETCFISVWEPAYFQLWIIYGLGDSSCNHLDGTAGQKGGEVTGICI
jgi:hypothetical protein